MKDIKTNNIAIFVAAMLAVLAIWAMIPMATIVALNNLFDMNIKLNFMNWVSVLVLLVVAKKFPFITISKK